MTCQHTMTLGVYLLGALEPAERSEFESHLSYCDICRGELVRLSPLPGLLNQITPEDFADGLPPTDPAAAAVLVQAQPVTEPVSVQAPEPAAELLPAPAPPPPRPPRRYWRVAAAAAAVVVVAVGAIFGWRTFREEGPPPQAEGVTWSVSAGEASAQARLVEHEWGTEIQSKVKGLPPGRECYLVVYDHYGNRETAGWWGTDHDPNMEIPGSTSIPRSKIDRLVYMLDDKETVALTIDAPGE